VDPVERRRATIYIAIPNYSIPQLICRMRRSRRYQALLMYIYINIKRGEENGIKRLRMLCYARNEKGIVGGF
jgi:hypothetical protein